MSSPISPKVCCSLPRSRAFPRPDDFARLAEEFATDALRRGVIYSEVAIPPSVWRSSFYCWEVSCPVSLRSSQLAKVFGALATPPYNLCPTVCVWPWLRGFLIAAGA